MGPLKLIVGLIVVAAVVLFGAQNTQAVTLHFLVFKVPSVPMVLALIAAVALGVLLGWIVSAPGRFRRMRERHELQGQVTAHERADAAAARSNEVHDI
ncbi:MAG TPA: LapA family protein [Chloroflexota bacterium]|nr:LapA family protein [Chloroflexota bacterium]